MNHTGEKKRKKKGPIPEVSGIVIDGYDIYFRRLGRQGGQLAGPSLSPFFPQYKIRYSLEAEPQTFGWVAQRTYHWTTASSHTGEKSDIISFLKQATHSALQNASHCICVIPSCAKNYQYFTERDVSVIVVKNLYCFAIVMVYNFIWSNILCSQ